MSFDTAKNEKTALGVDYKNRRHFSNATELINSRYKKSGAGHDKDDSIYPKIDAKQRILSTDLAVQKPKVDEFPFDLLQEFLLHNDSVEKGKSNHLSSDGTVIFGSGQVPVKYAQEIYELSAILGKHNYPVYTGGAGGVMYIANMGAYDAGGKSIGIYVGGAKKLKTENMIHTEVQTESVVTPGYISRIPLLLGNRELVIVAPGGSGTMREIAVAMVQWASGNINTNQKIVFFKSDYYKPLFDWLMNSNLPQEFKSRLVLIDKPKEILNLIKQDQINKPRSERTKFPLPKKSRED
jgi:uncharacterized protein (TIGR00725 family)